MNYKEEAKGRIDTQICVSFGPNGERLEFRDALKVDTTKVSANGNYKSSRIKIQISKDGKSLYKFLTVSKIHELEKVLKDYPAQKELKEGENKVIFYDKNPLPFEKYKNPEGNEYEYKSISIIHSQKYTGCFVNIGKGWCTLREDRTIDTERETEKIGFPITLYHLYSMVHQTAIFCDAMQIAEIQDYYRYKRNHPEL